MFIFVELFRVVGEQIGFEVLVFCPASPDMVDVLFSVFWFSEFSFSSWIYWFQNLEIFPPFLRNSYDEIIWWFWVTIVTVNFTCRYFKFSWNTSALSQSNGRNFSGSSIKVKTRDYSVTKKNGGTRLFKGTVFTWIFPSSC